MSGMLGHAAGYGIGQVAQGPTLEEAEAQVARQYDALDGALAKYRNTRSGDLPLGLEVIAHRAQVLSSLASDFMGAAYNLQRAAYDKATK